MQFPGCKKNNFLTPSTTFHYCENLTFNIFNSTIMEKQIKIFDTTLRDGEQSPGFSMNQNEKLRLALQLERLGADVIEAGFPIASDGDFETVKQISKEVKSSTLAALCRTRKKDIQRAVDALRQTENSRIHIFIATSDIHMKYKLKMSRKAVLESAVEAVEYAKDKCMEIGRASCRERGWIGVGVGEVGRMEVKG